MTLKMPYDHAKKILASNFGKLFSAMGISEDKKIMYVVTELDSNEVDLVSGYVEKH